MKLSVFLLLFLVISCQHTPTSTEKYADFAKTLPKGASCPELDAKKAAEIVSISLACVDNEYPNKPGHIYVNDDSLKPPKMVTPVFYGCFDWHSAVHGHWTMVKILKMFPNIKESVEISKVLNSHFTPEKLAQELAFFNEKLHRSFERTYGWAWFLRLYAEIYTFDDPDAKRWAKNMQPLADELSKRIEKYLNKLTVSVRVGTHSNLAFGLNHIFDYAVATGNKSLQNIIKIKAKKFYLNDKTCPVAYEPSGVDFISPCMAEAYLMQRVLPQKEFVIWLNGFFPPLYSDDFHNLQAPPEIKDKKDYQIGHLIGLSFQRAWSMNGVAKALPDSDPRKEIFRKIADVHCEKGLSDMKESGYGGSHWLASFATFMLVGD
jgi:hypothetical protein